MEKPNRGKRGFLRVLLTGVCTLLLTSTVASASEIVRVFVDGTEVHANKPALLDGGTVLVPVRAIAESLGKQVIWDKENRTVHIRTEGLPNDEEGIVIGEPGDDQLGSSESGNELSLDDVKSWVRDQGKEMDASSYYYDALVFESVNLDLDPEPEVLARIDAAVHLGNFFVFDRQKDGSYRLIFERAWCVLSWNEVVSFAGEVPMFEIVTTTGGTGVDVREAHLMYMNGEQVWSEAWSGILKDRSVFQDTYHLLLGNYQLSDDNRELMYWQTEMTYTADEMKQVNEPKTVLGRYQWANGEFMKMNVGE